MKQGTISALCLLLSVTEHSEQSFQEGCLQNIAYGRTQFLKLLKLRSGHADGFICPHTIGRDEGSIDIRLDKKLPQTLCALVRDPSHSHVAVLVQ